MPRHLLLGIREYSDTMIPCGRNAERRPTIWMSSASSEGAITIMLGSVAMYVTSKAPQCVAPSAPTSPPRSIAKRTAASAKQLLRQVGFANCTSANSPSQSALQQVPHSCFGKLPLPTAHLQIVHRKADCSQQPTGVPPMLLRILVPLEGQAHPCPQLQRCGNANCCQNHKLTAIPTVAIHPSSSLQAGIQHRHARCPGSMAKLRRRAWHLGIAAHLAGPVARRHAPPGRSRAAGRWSRWRRRAPAPRTPTPPQKSPAVTASGVLQGKQYASVATHQPEAAGSTMLQIMPTPAAPCAICKCDVSHGHCKRRK